MRPYFNKLKSIPRKHHKGHLVLQSLRTSTVFTEWKMAKLTAVYKKNDETDRKLQALIYTKNS